MKVALDFEYENFSIHKEQQNMCPVKIGLIFYFVLYIYIYIRTHSKSMYLVRSFVLNA